MLLKDVFSVLCCERKSRSDGCVGFGVDARLCHYLSRLCHLGVCVCVSVSTPSVSLSRVCVSGHGLLCSGLPDSSMSAATLSKLQSNLPASLSAHSTAVRG